VTQHPSSGYAGDIVIPSVVAYNGFIFDVISIGSDAFYFCLSLTSITIPKKVTNIKGNVFIGCTALTSINVESENPNYFSENGILFNKNKTKLISYPAGKMEYHYSVPSSVTTMGSNAFTCSRFSTIDIPNSVTNIEGAAFFGCWGLTSITIPTSIKTISDSTFMYCYKLTSVNIPNSVTKIENNAFYDCQNLTSIDIPESVTTIGEFAFFNCKGLTSVKIPDGIKSIKPATFSGCTNLATVVIPSSVSSIVWYAFSGCTSLTSLTNLNPIPFFIDTDVFEWMDQSACTLYVPVGSCSAYKNADVWKEFNVVEIGSAIEPVEIESFKIFPNPTTGKVYIETESNIKVFNLQGELLKETSGNQVDLSDYPQGVYLLQVNGRWSKVARQ